MAKLIKGDSVQNIITDGDVIITSPSKIGKTLNEVLDDQQSDIDKLKSNVKYIYAYGGVGGSGSGGSGTVEKPINVFIELNGKEICKNGDDAVVLDGKGNYTLKIKISNAGEKTYYMGYSTNGSVDDKNIKYELKGDNRYKIDVNLSLNENGTLNIKIIDSEDNLIGYYYQNYIVESDIFNVTLRYTDIQGKIQSLSKPYECFVEDQFRLKRHFKIDYSIFLLNYSEPHVECYIDGGATLIYDDSDNIEISLENDENCGVLINGEPILQDKYHGTYTLKAILSYKISGEIIRREKSLTFSVVPSSLYVNVRTNVDVLYDDVNLLEKDILNGVNRYISQGSSLMLYCKVFEGSKEGDGNIYTTTFTAYNANIEDGNIVGWESIGVETTDYLKEQVESVKGVSLTFPTEGIKKIIISTSGAKNNIGVPQYFEKYLYVKKFDNKCDWFNSDRHKCISDSYFKANQGDKTYSKDEYGNYTFPPFSSGNGVLSLTKSSDIITIDQSNLEPNESLLCTVITFGIQISNINSENAKIVDIYAPKIQDPVYSLKINSLFSDDGSNKIAIPTEVLDKNDNSKYHLVQIIRNLSNIENNDSPIFEDSLYIDGLLESSDVSTVSYPSKVSKILLQNINACYNLINIQYFSYENDNGNKFNPDAYAYQYWLAYKEKYVNSGSSENRLTEDELFFINANNMDRISFDGTNVVVDTSIIMNIAKISDLPTVVFSYNCENGDIKGISEFMEDMWLGRTNGDSTFKSKEIKLYWIPERTDEDKFENCEVKIPELTDYKINEDGSANPITANWAIGLQGTSTMRNRIKNYSLRIESQSSGGGDEKILFSPKFNIDFDPEKEQSFLPDVEWTIKADIADSAHANNTSIGKFVNKVCSKIDTKIPDISEDAKKFIKNTLEGIPVLLYFMCEGLDENGNQSIKTYYFGIYNFNLGRNSYYNLGYNGGIADEKNKTSDFMRVFNNIKNNVQGKYEQGKVFSFAVGECKLSQNITIGEIQENSPQFDFHQYQSSLLFKDEGSTNNNCMFGSIDKITSSNFNNSKVALIDLVKGVAKAGKFCFQESGRTNDFVTSRYFSYDENGKITYDRDEVCLNRYLEEKIPDPIYQITYDSNGRMVWKEDRECDNVSIADLKKLIIEYELPSGDMNVPLLDYTSASEYYTICMAFGMVDSVLKNMNLKNFSKIDEGSKFYCAFYDMDCALEENNAGLEDITYLAATDYWYSPIDSNNKVGLVEKKNDYWNSDVGSGFDFTSSYLFAVIKYAKSIFENLPKGEDKFDTQLSNFPQNFWAKLRKYNGELRSADYFMEKYFKSGITTTFEYLASLNYRVKYLYRGKSFDSDGGYTDKYLANSGAFNGSRKIKAKNWLKNRLRFLDAMMNVNCLSIPISKSSMLKIPSPKDFKSDLMQNPDITILHSAFNSDSSNKAQSTFSGDVSIYAPAYTPFIFQKGTSSADMYLLPGGIDRPNILYLTTTEAENTYFYGSGLFTSIDKIESTFTEYNSIISDNLESFEYGGSPRIKGNSGRGFFINAKSVRDVNLNIPKMGGKLEIQSDCISVEKINIAGSEFNGEFTSFPNLKEVNISGVKTPPDKGIIVANSDYLTGEKFYISGKDKENKTTLGFLNISGKMTGKFNCNYTDIEKISIENKIKNEDIDFSSEKLAEFSIYDDSKLRELSLKGFRKVSITGCNNLEKLSIDGVLEELYINLSKGIDETTSKLETISLGTTESETGVFDLSNYTKLKKVTLKNCDRLVHLKLPDNDIETEGMSNNVNLKFIDTGSLPAFINSYESKAGVIYPSYSEGKKLILCSHSAFDECPNYSMLRSDWNSKIDGRAEISYTNIKVSENCTSLANTFRTSVYIPENSDNKEFDMNAAIMFIDKFVPDDIKGKITSLKGCFKGRYDIVYSDLTAKKEKNYGKNYHPSLKSYTSLNDISYMYEGTRVSFVTKDLLDLSFEKNVRENKLDWSNFLSNNYMNNMWITEDALYNISYRLTSYNGITFNIYEYNIDTKEYVQVGQNKEKMFKICDFFHPFKENEGKGVKEYSDKYGYEFTNLTPYEDIRELKNIKFGEQYIDFRGMFDLFPNINKLENFLNGNLSRYNINYLLKPCKNIISIYNSFCDDKINENTQTIDLYNFFNWEGNTKDIEQLFEGQTVDGFTNGFKIKKTISFDNLTNILNNIIPTYSKLKRLTNIFSYCTIKDYKNESIEFGENVNALKNIVNISFLFENCTSDYKPLKDDPNNAKGVYNGGVLNIGRSFFKKIPNFTVAQRTFANTYISSPLTYDYFCKRNETMNEPKEVSLSTNSDDTATATLYMYGYKPHIINLKECFYNTKFVNCKNWFDETDEVNKKIGIDRNYIMLGDKKIDTRGFVYYIYNDISGTYENCILDNDIIDDCKDNYTNFVPYNEILNDGKTHKWMNHDLKQDLIYYGNIKDGVYPFKIEDNTDIVQKTYCCLPPDLLYGCDTEKVDISGIFANSNIIGVIPRNLTKNIKKNTGNKTNIFKNVNIMPNIEYYYNGDTADNFGNILFDNDNGVNNFEDDNVINASEYKVIFRDEYGKLQRRKPKDGDRNLGQFVYVPNNFILNNNITELFNFRYNLPKHWEMPSSPDGTSVGYKSTVEFNEAINNGVLDITYHNQYYFTTDKSVNWKDISLATNVFISDGDDIDFGNKNTIGYQRSYYAGSSEEGLHTKYIWTDTTDKSLWISKNVDNFNIDLNLCGKKNENNMIEDYGCPIIVDKGQTTIRVKLDNFVSGILTIFLNGRVFYDGFEVGHLTEGNKSSDGNYIINYHGFGKNIILPQFNSRNDEYKFIPAGANNIYFDFMLNNGDISEYKYNVNYIDETKYKYKFKPQ